MADDALTLREVRLTGFSVPDQMSGGGRQDPVIHKLSGGTRIIGARGPDDHAIFGASSSMTTPRSVGPSRSSAGSPSPFGMVTTSISQDILQRRKPLLGVFENFKLPR